VNYRALGLIVVFATSLSFAQSSSKKQDDLPKFFLNARYAYVEAMDGRVFDLRLVDEDRKAILDVENALRTWNRYMVTLKRREADLVFVVRKGRIVDVHGSVGGGGGNHPANGEDSARSGTRPDATGSLDAEAGSPDDLLYVYTLHPDGSLQGPIWKQYLKNGLNAPEIPLFKQLKEAVEAAEKQQPATK
jgi:hypothetical protein